MAERVEGIRRLRETIEAVSIELKTKVALRTTAAGANEVKKEAKAIIRQKGLIETRALINNVVIKRERKVPEGTVQYNVGVRHGYGLGNGKRVIKYLAVSKSGRIVTRRKDDPYYWRFLEFGHKLVPRSTGTKGNVFTTYIRTRNGKVRTVNRRVRADALSVRRRSPTGFVEATPFIRPALESSQDAALRAMEKQAVKLLEVKK